MITHISPGITHRVGAMHSYHPLQRRYDAGAPRAECLHLAVSSPLVTSGAMRYHYHTGCTACSLRLAPSLPPNTGSSPPRLAPFHLTLPAADVFLTSVRESLCYGGRLSVYAARRFLNTVSGIQLLMHATDSSAVMHIVLTHPLTASHAHSHILTTLNLPPPSSQFCIIHSCSQQAVFSASFLLY